MSRPVLLRREAVATAAPAACVTRVRGRRGGPPVAVALARELGESLAFHCRYPIAVVVPGGERRVDRRITSASVEVIAADGAAIEPLVERLSRSHAHVVVAGPAGHDAEGTPGPVVATLERAGEPVAIADDEGRPRTRRELLRASRAVGAAVLPVAGLARGAPARTDVDRVARELAGLTVGVALGAGGTRGFAHVGVLTALRDLGVPVDFIAGSSVGSVVGTLWAFGHPPDDIVRGLSATRRFLVRPALPWRSLLGSSGIREHITVSAAGRSFEDAPIPLAAVATDLHEGSEVVLRTGPIWPAVLASSSIPVLYPPVELDGRWLVDGGIAAPVPVRATAALGAGKVIAVKLDVGPTGRRAPSIVDAALRSIDILQARAAQASTAGAAVVVAPRLGKGGFDDASRTRDLGEEAVAAALDDLRRSLPWLTAANARG